MYRGLALIIIPVLLLMALAGEARAASDALNPNYQHLQYFVGTPNELNVYRVYGVKPGKTLMIIGGIQGDEAGAFLSADMYADIALAKGNLIVVPRANLYSIILNNRGPDGDMNRQFGSLVTSDRQKQIIEVLKDLIGESDVLLNLHEGSGFYRHTWESDMANPNRYGQCIIADTDVYTTSDGKRIDLAAMAEAVLVEVNKEIDNPQHKLLFNNHRTSQQDSMHKEQRLSATYFALTQCHIPAFGVEASKSITDLSLKVHYHNLVINAFMNHFDIVPQTPSLYLPAPELHYLVIKVNNESFLRVVPASGELLLNPGDRISVEHIEGNYSRGFYCTVLGLGTINDLGKEFVINKPTRILVRKDNSKIGEIKIVLNNAPTGEKPAPEGPAPGNGDNGREEPSSPSLWLEVEGQAHYVPDGGSITLLSGDKLVIKDMLGLGPGKRDNLEVNFKGYVPPGKPNTGDDRGYTIDTAKELMTSYAVQSDGISTTYPIIVSQGRQQLASMRVVISARPDWEYVLYGLSQDCLQLCRPGQELLYVKDARVFDVKTALNGQLTYVLSASGGGQSILKDGMLDDKFITRAWQNNEQVRLAWQRAGQTLGQINLKQREN